MPFQPLGSLFDRQKCPECGNPLRWGITTEIDKKTNSEVCRICRAVLGKKD
jgi:hypothetical protein